MRTKFTTMHRAENIRQVEAYVAFRLVFTNRVQLNLHPSQVTFSKVGVTRPPVATPVQNVPFAAPVESHSASQ